MSDDVIGLMNWIVVKSGHKIKSHATRGIEYAISLKSLKRLHAHIIDMYTDLDPHFIYGFPVDAPEELFTLELKPGECYLDELLMGKFLHFESLLASISLYIFCKERNLDQKLESKKENREQIQTLISCLYFRNFPIKFRASLVSKDSFFCMYGLSLANIDTLENNF